MTILIAQAILTAAASSAIAFSFVFFIAGLLRIASKPTGLPTIATIASQPTVEDTELIECSEWEYAPVETIPAPAPEYTAPIIPSIALTPDPIIVMPAIYTKKQAMQIAKDKQIKGRSKMNLAELLAAIAAIS